MRKLLYTLMVVGLIALGGATLSPAVASAQAGVLPPVESGALFVVSASAVPNGSVISRVDSNGNATTLVPAISFSTNSTLLFDPSLNKLVVVNNSEVWHIDPVTGEKQQLLFLPGPGIGNAAAVDSSGNLFVAMSESDRGGRIIKIDPSGGITEFVRLGSARSDSPSERGMAFDPAGNLAVLVRDARILKVDPSGNITTFVTVPRTDGGAGAHRGIAYDHNGHLFVSASVNTSGSIQRIDPAGNATIVVQSIGGACPDQTDLTSNYGIAFDSAGALYAANLTNYCRPESVVKIDPNTGALAAYVSGLPDQRAALAFEVSSPDTTPPLITKTITGTVGDNGWYTSEVQVTWTVTEPESPVTIVSGCGTESFTSDTTGVTSSCSATSAGGSASDSVILKLDKTPPTNLSITGGPAAGGSYYFGSVPAAPTGCTADAAISGLASCEVTGYQSGVGTHTLTATATDNAGNTTTATRSYSVLAWRLSGFYSPVDMPIPTDLVFNTVKGGSTVPLKFEVFAAEELTDPAVVKSLSYAGISCDASAPTDEIETLATGGTGLRYDTTAGQFVYNWKTPKRTGCIRLTLTTQDNSSLVAYFKLR